MSSEASHVGSTPGQPEGQPSRREAGGEVRYPTVVWTLVAVGTLGAFHLARLGGTCTVCALLHLSALLFLRKLPSSRWAFYVTLLVGVGMYAPPLAFFYGLFGPPAVLLWLLLAIWPATFVVLVRWIEKSKGRTLALIVAPFLWTCLEYIRCEVWWLRFSWLSVGSLLEHLGPFAWQTFGVYGLGTLAMGGAALAQGIAQRNSSWWTFQIIPIWLALLLGMRQIPMNHPISSRPPLRFAAVQLEFPGFPELLQALNRVAVEKPEAELVLLPEYALDGPVPDSLREWCRRHQKWLVIGGKELIDSTNYYNTAFVLGTNGATVFQQAKSRPIQLFKDGQPAISQQVWDSPWGKLGIAICYDASYRQVMDELLRQGAAAFLVLSMDVEDWGAREHRLNAQQARLRCLESGVPMVRVGSSGISQWISATGKELATAEFPGPGAVLSGALEIPDSPGTRPWDSWFAPLCAIAGVGLGAVQVFRSLLRSIKSFIFRSNLMAKPLF